MRIVFLCACLEPGKDGVGDYTLQLATQLVKRGHSILAISLNDKFSEVLLTEQKTIGDSDLHFLRLPSNWTLEKRFEHAKNSIRLFKPDWISLQFVIYSYHPKGLPFGLGKLFKGLGENIKFHIMFHEIWIGVSNISSVKHKIIGYFQKKIIKSIVKSTQPKLITTSNILYKLILKNINVHPTILPLFSNIELAPKNDTFISGILTSLGVVSEAELVNWNITGIFGKLHPDTALEPILLQQILKSQQSNLNMAFIAFGNTGQEGIKEFKRLEGALSEHVKFLFLGELTPEQVSNAMTLLNTGISCTPLPYIGKSGVFATMKLHAIDVIIPEDHRFPEFENELNAFQSDIGSRMPKDWSVENVAETFVSLLSMY